LMLLFQHFIFWISVWELFFDSYYHIGTGLRTIVTPHL
jgi:hypothetical protein